MLTANLDAIVRLNDCINNGDSGGAAKCMVNFIVDMSVYDSEHAAFIIRALMIKLLEEHSELLDDAELRSQWEICLNQTGNSGFSVRFDADVRFPSVRAVMEHKKAAADILKVLFDRACGGSKSTPICSMNPEIIILWESAILTADLFDNTEILEYAADMYSRYAGAEMRNGLWFLMACLIDREMYDPLDKLYKNCCGSDFIKLLNSCCSINYQAKENVFYIKSLYRRYVSGGKVTGDENVRICSLIASSEYINNCFGSPRFFGREGLADESVTREFAALSEIGFKTDDISMFLRYIDISEVLDECVEPLIGNSPYFYLDDLLHIMRLEKVKAFLENKNVYISIDNHSGPMMLFDASSSIFKEKWLRENTKDFPIRITDSVRENSYLNRVMEYRATALNFLLKTMELSLEQLYELVELCLEYNNYSAMNAVRKKINAMAN